MPCIAEHKPSNNSMKSRAEFCKKMQISFDNINFLYCIVIDTFGVQSNVTYSLNIHKISFNGAFQCVLRELESCGHEKKIHKSGNKLQNSQSGYVHRFEMLHTF